MNLPRQIQLESFLGKDACLVERIFGGSIAECWQVAYRGETCFLKYYPNKPEIVEAEIYGLEAIGTKQGVRVPKVLKVNGDRLLLEWIEAKVPTREDMYAFGESLASLHSDQSGMIGFKMDNYIGESLQKNQPQLLMSKSAWADYFYHSRLGYQVELAQSSPYGDEIVNLHRNSREAVLAKLSQVEDYSCLLHGDLWRGNFIVSPSGDTYVFDPAVYYGSPEVDISMSTLFGGFNKSFYEGYFSKISFAKGYEEREPIYHLYNVLNHLNLFGSAYYTQVCEIYRRIDR